MKRLYIGGLSPTVTEKDLKDRFGKFGDVTDVDIITRKDDQGAPLKTFGYININITDAEYKRCIGILNKSKWKGGTLLIQLAKESFLHRLAEERQQLVEKAKTPKIIPQEKLMDSFKAAGVENFHMKAAVPGTEVPGHKDWVVSKFGRVLPVLNLQSKGKKKFFKYDPSKHCHNIKRLETADDFTSVSKLTWEIDGGDDEISKKRRGEFPKQKPCPKRPKIDLSVFLSNAMNATKTQQNGLPATKTGKQRPVNTKSVCVFNNDHDSDDEIRMLVAQEHLRNPKPTFIGDDEDNLEVVGDDFAVKSNAFWGGTGQNYVKSLLVSSKEDEEYDSADTDEILTQRKTPKLQVNQDSPTKSNAVCGGTEQNDVKSLEASSKEVDTDEILTQRKIPKLQVSPTKSNKNECSSDGDSDDDDSVDSDYEAMMGNCYRLELSLADLEQLAKSAEVISDDERVEEPEEPKIPSPPPKKTGNDPEDILASLLGDDTPEKESKKKKKQVTTKSLPAFIGTKDLFGDPEPILKSIDCESPKQALKLKKQSTSQLDSSNQPLQQVQSASKRLENKASNADDSASEESDEEMCSRTVSKPKLKNIPIEPKQTKPSTSSSEDSSNEVLQISEIKETISKTEVTSNKSNTPIKPKQTKLSTETSSETISEDEPKTKLTSNTPNTPVKPSSSSSEESESSEDEKVESLPKVLLSTVIDARKQQQDNQKRIAALEQRQKESEQQKKLIQGALSNVDSVKANKSKHIVFDSDEEDNESAGKPEQQPTSQKRSLFEDDSESDEASTSKEKEDKSGGSKLFDSGDEDDGSEDERFQIKPQFEGKAGAKLMKLQARFGTDSRFQIDSRFLESDDEAEEQDAEAPDAEEELLEEKKKNLDILQSILKTSIEPQNTKKSKTFKDVSGLHYDPTREEHSAFETKIEQPKKESKAARRKKREEAAKLPEVSKDIYFDVAVDLKEVFGTSKDNQVNKENVSWDKEAEETEDIQAPMEVSFTSNAESNKDTSGGFMFSFFGGDTAAETTAKTDEYKIETLKAAKFSWQVDPRFQDSSSDEEGNDEVEEDQSASSKITEEPAPSRKAFFFFRLDDERLKEGPGMFCRSVKLEDQREAWEEKRTSLREEFRKKHRDAKRRQRPSLKT